MLFSFLFSLTDQIYFLLSIVTLFRDPIDCNFGAMVQVKMLEALQDIEIASKLVGFDSDNDESLDDKYKKLRCAITPLPHDCEDYKLVEKYLLNTHAPTHKACIFFCIQNPYSFFFLL